MIDYRYGRIPLLRVVDELCYHFQKGDVIEFRPLDPELPDEYHVPVYKIGYLCASGFPLVSNVSYALLRRRGFARGTD